MTCVVEELQWKLYILQKDRQGWGHGELVPYFREYFGCLGISSADGRVECLWLGIRGKNNKAGGSCYGPFSQDEEGDEILYNTWEKSQNHHLLFSWRTSTYQMTADNRLM